MHRDKHSFEGLPIGLCHFNRSRNDTPVFARRVWGCEAVSSDVANPFWDNAPILTKPPSEVVSGDRLAGKRAQSVDALCPRLWLNRISRGGCVGHDAVAHAATRWAPIASTMMTGSSSCLAATCSMYLFHSGNQSVVEMRSWVICRS